MKLGSKLWRVVPAVGSAESKLKLELQRSMRIDVLTLFPAMFAGPLDESIIKRARDAGLLDLSLHQLRYWAHDRHKTVDDRPFGGGPGMLLKPSRSLKRWKV